MTRATLAMATTAMSAIRYQFIEPCQISGIPGKISYSHVVVQRCLSKKCKPRSEWSDLRLHKLLFTE